MTQQRRDDDLYPGIIIAPGHDGIDDAEAELPDFIQKDNVGWRKVADIRDGWQRLTQAVKATLDNL